MDDDWGYPYDLGNNHIGGKELGLYLYLFVPNQNLSVKFWQFDQTLGWLPSIFGSPQQIDISPLLLAAIFHLKHEQKSLKNEIWSKYFFPSHGRTPVLHDRFGIFPFTKTHQPTSHFGVPPFWKPPRMTGQWGRLPDRPHRPVLFLVPVAVTVRMPAPRRVAGHPPMGSIIGYPENDMEIEKTTDIVK